MKEIMMNSQVNTPEGRQWMRDMLKLGEMTVVFTKKDGTDRSMLCTLVESQIPVEKAPKNTGKAKSDDAMAVFDIEKQEWRSFRFDSVKEIRLTIGD
jgi:hypothetical protein